MISPVVPNTVRNSCIAIGNFDGVHRGHCAMLQQLRQLAVRLAVPAVAVTFDPHPIAILRPEFTPPILTTLLDRIQLLRDAGVDDVVVLPVTRELLQMSPQQFFQEVVLNHFQARGLVEGPNFHFGRNREGNVQLLRTLCYSAGLEFQEVPAISNAGEMISSSLIRELLSQRSLHAATQLLGHPYRIRGTVQHGAERGRTLGFPTANLGDVPNLIPAHGVYAGVSHIEGCTFPAAVSIGPNPTFADQRLKIECHFPGFSGNLYDQEIAVDLLAEIRPLRSFASVTELVQQITTDIRKCQELASAWITRSSAESTGH